MAKLSEQPELESLNYKPTGVTDTGGVIANPNPLKQPETPGPMQYIKAIEDLVNQVNEIFTEIPFNTVNDKIIAQALEEIDLFQKTTLFELRKAFE